MKLRQTWRRQLGLDNSGVAALEFALVAAPFFALLAGLFEIGMIFLAQTSFERQVDSLARMVKTGQVQELAWNRADVRQFLCSGLFVATTCRQDLRLDIRQLGSVAGSRNFVGQGLESDGLLRFGGADEIVMLRAELDYQPIFAAGGISPMTGIAGGPFIFSAALAFRNEPF